MILDIVIVLAIANLITEQTITRRLINNIFKPEHYLTFSGWKRFIYDLISCWSCTSFHIGWIYLIVKQEPISLQYIIIPLIAMMVADVILKLK